MKGMQSSLPPVPRRNGRTAAPLRPARRSLSRESIVEIALELLDAEGLVAVTMRRVAGELDTGPASLYAHFADKEEMVAALLDRVFGEVTLPIEIVATQWQEQLKLVMRALRTTLSQHRDIAVATLGNVPVGENALRVSNTMVGILLAGGVSERVASFGVDLLSLYIGAVSYEESMDAHTPGPEGEVYHAQLREFFQALPADRYPYLVALSAALTEGDGEERFEFGLDLLVRGLASTIPDH